jgi:hypothetical protein
MKKFLRPKHRTKMKFIDKGPAGAGVAQWTSHPPKEQKTRVRIPPGNNVFSGKSWQ